MENLTKKQQTFVKEYIETGNGTQSALKAYDTTSEAVASAIAVENLQKPMIVEVIHSLAERISDDKLYQVLTDGLDASNEITDNEGNVLYVRPAFSVRHKYLDTALKLKGLYEEDQQRNINILMPVLVKFLDAKDERSDSGDTK